MAEELEEAIRAAAEFGDGFDKIYQRLRKAGYTWNHKKGIQGIQEDALQQENQAQEKTSAKSQGAA